VRSFWLGCVVLLGGLQACTMPNQVVNSPCVGKPATGALGECPTCFTDDDCKLLSNLCEPFAYCVHKDSSWQPNAARTCSEDEQYHPTTQSCQCLGNVCDWSYKRSR
jgi:hypothetical protein